MATVEPFIESERMNWIFFEILFVYLIFGGGDKVQGGKHAKLLGRYIEEGLNSNEIKADEVWEANGRLNMKYVMLWEVVKKKIYYSILLCKYAFLCEMWSIGVSIAGIGMLVEVFFKSVKIGRLLLRSRCTLYIQCSTTDNELLDCMYCRIIF